MKCDDCKFADWKRTAAGKLHPDKTGRCTRLREFPLDLRLPAAFYFVFEPHPSGGFIERGSELRAKCDFKMVGN